MKLAKTRTAPRRARALLLIATAEFAIGFAGPSAHALDHSWNAGTGNWGSSGNWSPTSVPGTSDIVYLNRLVGGQRGVVNVINGPFPAPVSVNIRNLNELSIANGNSF